MHISLVSGNTTTIEVFKSRVSRFPGTLYMCQMSKTSAGRLVTYSIHLCD